jgi:hypothetical protein
LKLNFIRVGTHNNHESVALSEAAESTQSKIPYHISKVTKVHICFATGFCLLKETKDRGEKELKGWMMVRSMIKRFFVNLTAQLNTLDKGLQGKDKLITKMSDRI